MRAHKLFHHPVGIFSFGARWYLASLAVLVLILVAVHFVIQIQAQEQARHLMQQWLGKSHISVGEVRYHLLRNALTLQKIHIQRGGDSLAIAQVLVRADAEALTADAPRLGLVELTGVVAELREFQSDDGLRNDAVLTRILHAVESLRFKNGKLIVYAGNAQAQPFEFDAISFDQQKNQESLNILASAELYGAPVSVVLEGPVQADMPGWRGKIVWQDVEAAAVMASMGWQQLSGLLQGEIAFQAGAGGDTSSKTGEASLRARVQLSAEDDADVHKLMLQGATEGGHWRFDVEARAWPLSPWAKLLPAVSGQNLLAAQWQGGMHVAEENGTWQGKSSEGLLQHVSWQSGVDRPGHLAQFGYRNLTWSEAGRLVQMEESSMQGLDVVVQAAPSDRSTDDGWRFGMQQFHLQHARIGLALPRGEITFSPLRGQGSISAQGMVDFSLMPEQEAADTHALPAGWMLAGKLQLQGGQWQRGSMQLTGKEISLQQLRAAIPIGGSQNIPLGLEGAVNVDANAIVDHGRWQIVGKAKVRGLVLTHAGDRWISDQVQIEFGPLGEHLPSQLISKLDIQGWRYTAPLYPLPGMSPTDASASEALAGPYWWATLLQRHNWVIQSMHCNDGSISVGREDGYWATGLQVQVQDLQADKVASFSLQGLVDGGALSADGTWQPLAEYPAIKFNAELHHANVFFLRDWMQSSGMPPVIRGRMSGKLVVGPKDGGRYQADMRIRLDRVKTEAVVSPDDPLLGRLGYRLADVLARLDDGKGKAAVAFSVAGGWQHEPLSVQRLGKALQRSMLASMKKGPTSFAGPSEPLHSARVRLHAKGGLSYNERTRLRKLWRQLRDHKTWIVDLEPVWTAGAMLDEELVRRIRYTQGLIENFMHDRNIDQGRLFPQWPQQRSRSQDPAYIRVLIRPAG